MEFSISTAVLHDAALLAAASGIATTIVAVIDRRRRRLLDEQLTGFARSLSQGVLSEFKNDRELIQKLGAALSEVQNAGAGTAQQVQGMMQFDVASAQRLAQLEQVAIEIEGRLAQQADVLGSLVDQMERAARAPQPDPMATLRSLQEEFMARQPRPAPTQEPPTASRNFREAGMAMPNPVEGL